MWYNVVRSLLVPMFKVCYRSEISGREHIPKTGPVILAANHTSYIDPPLVAVAIGRREINFMAKASLLKIPLFGLLLKSLNTFPVKRGVADKGAIAYSLKILSEGKVLLIFPEGTRIRNEELGKPYPGITAIALKTGVPIVPIGLIGTGNVMPDGTKLPRFTKLKVRIGEPIPVEKVGASERKVKEAELTERVMNEIRKLIQS